MSPIILGSFTVLLIGIILCISGSKGGSVELCSAGVVLTIFSILFGFGVLSCLVPVAEKTEIIVPISVISNEYVLTAVYDDDQVISSTNARLVKDGTIDNIVIEKRMEYSSYKFEVSRSFNFVLQSDGVKNEK